MAKYKKLGSVTLFDAQNTKEELSKLGNPLEQNQNLIQNTCKSICKEETLKDGDNAQIIKAMINISDINSSKLKHKDEVISSLNEAINYLSGYSWCVNIEDGWIASSFGYILNIFYSN